ncbi:hypothetical protein T458_18805 [Brevibacillus panacihumi W25]|uniref:Uncharacterized protein n=1 Tax=Brevibacillus panacihumi W25 TaxID=1408254 RepID=V6M7J1_9BACL|nr:hypothetical protein T458_18805 [Brevibacillus panacihumi W25]
MTKQPIWAWIVIGITGLFILKYGLAVLALPILPILLAGFATDSPGTPGYVPIVVMIVSYLILLGWLLLLIFAIRSVVRANKK